MAGCIKHANILISALMILSLGACDQANFAGKASDGSKPSKPADSSTNPNGTDSGDDARADAPVQTGGSFLVSLSCEKDPAIVELDPNIVGVGCSIVDSAKQKIPLTPDSVTDLSFLASTGDEITISIQTLIDQLASPWHWNLHIPKDALKGSQFKVKYFDKWLTFNMDGLPGGLPIPEEISLLPSQERLYGIRIGNGDWDPIPNQDCVKNGQWETATKAPVKGNTAIYAFRADGETVIQLSGICGIQEGFSTPVYVRRRSDQKILNTINLKTNVVSATITFKNPKPTEVYELVFTTLPAPSPGLPGDTDDYHIKTLNAKGLGLQLIP